MNWQIIVGAIFFIVGIGSIASDFGVFVFGFLVGGALIVWGLHKKGIINIRKLLMKKSPALLEENLWLVGVSYCISNIEKLKRKDSRWSMSAKEIIEAGLAGKKVYRYNFNNNPVELNPEPNNPHDKNAIAVYIAGLKVGYISKEENLRILGILNTRDIKSISCFVGGGDYKVVSGNGDVFEGEHSISISVRIKYV